MAIQLQRAAARARLAMALPEIKSRTRRNTAMRAMRVHAPRVPLACDTLPDPEPGPGQVLVRVQACGVCRTDLHIADGELSGAPYPITPGHEVVGKIVSKGGNAARFVVGSRIGIPWRGLRGGRCSPSPAPATRPARPLRCNAAHVGPATPPRRRPSRWTRAGRRRAVAYAVRPGVRPEMRPRTPMMMRYSATM